ncbi:MAG: efflux RND transporter periplasmic adaptor subunit [Kangiellaceae bacterium]|jgi:RND family efflux transporter MFP subunit|nr:efflux RND transporter periplasmic adaptor subunit [Kangiellaceae bacterium]
MLKKVFDSKAYIVVVYLMFATVNSFAEEFSKVREIRITNKIYLNANIEAIKESTVSAQVSARVKSINVDIDDKVSPGSILVKLDDTEILASLEQAKANLKVAEADHSKASADYRRYLELASKDYVSEEQITRSKNARDVTLQRIKVAKAQIKQASQQLDYTIIKAPYGGVVTERQVEVGEVVQVGQSLLTGIALNQNRLYLDVPQSLINHLETNQYIWAKDTVGEWIKLNNLTIFAHADQQTHTVRVRANLPDTQLLYRPGSFLTVAIDAGERSILAIPDSAVIKQGDLNAVFVKLDEAIGLRQVILGTHFDDQVQVISGLTEGDLIVTDGSAYLSQEGR